MAATRHLLSLGLALSLAALADDPVDFAARQLGKPYKGDPSAVGPDAYDCSGLTKAAFEQAGITLPHHAASQAEFGRGVSGPFQRGDLLFFDSKEQPGNVAHVGIVEEGVTMINAHSYYGQVRRDDYTDPYWGSHFLFARRITEAGREEAPPRRFSFAPPVAARASFAPQRASFSRAPFGRARFVPHRASYAQHRAKRSRSKLSIRAVRCCPRTSRFRFRRHRAY